MTEEQLDRIGEWASDVAAAIGAALLLAFFAVVWGRVGFEPAMGALSLFGIAYMVGRHHCSKAWERDNANLKEALDGLLAEIKRIEAEESERTRKP